MGGLALAKLGAGKRFLRPVRDAPRSVFLEIFDTSYIEVFFDIAKEAPNKLPLSRRWTV